MSCSLWRWTEACDHRPCPGDCDLCGYDPEDPGYTQDDLRRWEEFDDDL